MDISIFRLGMRGVLLTILMLRRVVGSITSPYETYRMLSKDTRVFQIVPIYLLCALYFFWTSLVHKGVYEQFFTLAYSFFRLFFGALAGYLLMIFLLKTIGSLAGGKGSMRSIVMLWTYSLAPTLVWFFSTSFLFLLFPPPRTTSIQGQILSIVFISFSLFLFFWKAMLYYLTMRFGLKLSMGKIFLASLGIFPIVSFFSLYMYTIGIFRIPFL